MDDLSEHFPMSGLDELPIHQTTSPIRLVATTDPRAFERYWFTAYDSEGDVFIVAGFGLYPNLGTADAYAIIVTGGKQTTVRAHQAMDVDRSRMTFGPIGFENVRPFREWRLRLDENEQDFTFDLRWYDTKRAIFQRLNADLPGYIDRRLYHDWCGYETFGCVEGTIRYQGREFRFRKDQASGSRDHHWGVRDGNGGISLDRSTALVSHKGEPLSRSHLGQWVEFKDWSIWGWRALYNLGDHDNPGTKGVVTVDQKLRFDPVTKQLVGGVITNKLPDGEVRVVHYEKIADQCAYLRTAGYPGCNGLGTPGDNFHHGVAVGNRVDGETYDLTDVAVRESLFGFEDLLVRATCNGETVIGMLEARNPAIYIQALGGMGSTILEGEAP